jgi:DNA-3-methyladenine glycosylase I
MSKTTNENQHRCTWSESDPQMRDYHDTEWGMPEYDSRALWELLMLEGFQAGLAWIIVLRKREAFRKAFRGFDPHKIAKFTGKDIERLLADEGIIRSRAKIEATIAAARLYVAMEKSGESFSRYLWALAGGKPVQAKGPIAAQTPASIAMSKELKKRGFKFVGPTIVHAFMQASGMVNDHTEKCFRRKPCAVAGKARG